ncbi:toll-like receptor 4 [Mytilus californianus]|uniref:toll-like receptor 4 n=1 Tax=Mytilus californianus TaxID=6549 RepID=UPI0022458768|nr:toll-like receptor 4 [Mytilus californianus]
MASKITLKHLVIVLCICQYVVLAISLPCDFNEKCRCTNIPQHAEMGSEVMLNVDCSNRRLQDVPDLPANVYTLSLKKNNIKVINDYQFSLLRNLSELDLSYNKIKRLNRFSFNGLSNLLILNLNNNPLPYTERAIPSEVFKSLISLKHICIRFTSPIGTLLPEVALSNLKLLESLEIDIPLITPYKVIFGKSFDSLVHLETLKIGTCLVFGIKNDTFSHLVYLKNIYFDIICEILILPGAHHCLQKLHKIEMHFFSQYDVFSIVHATMELKLTPVQTIVFKNTFFHGREKPYYTWTALASGLNGSSVQNLQLTGNNPVSLFPLSKIEPAPPSFLTLNLSSNKLDQFELELTNIQKLILRDNHLGNFLRFKTFNKHIKRNSKLKYIDISMNRIYKLKSSIFHGHPELRYINLSHNYLQEVLFDVSQANYLKYLVLSNNFISGFNQKSMKMFDHLSLNSNLSIFLLNNSLECTCKTLLFWKWIVVTRVNVFFDRRCVSEDGTVVRFLSTNKIIPKLEKECIAYTSFIIIASIVLVATLICIAVAVVYKYRWKLRYMFYLAKSKHHRHKASTDDKQYVYDAFISYCEHDKSFVINDCIKNLEMERNFKLCVHQRDFIPGEEITTNITNAIHESRKTICILTKQFFDSYYCMFEFNMARMESIYSRDKRNIIFLIFVEQILPQNMPLVLLELVQKDSYIEYPNDQQGNVVFWDKIDEALRQ